ncbi:gamma carbonic anhydrase-like mitochondrial [Raphidocelis subcapitata]|uniref:Gamma carbonic anhydrase-like mitochondrial n=1 Tax=Raphidocelis subcapitata TaxID=307507 RepID=A0A2V0PJE7_9CHLO|nr:gamma carbonic anhydrase-like mitochondrial [Raphidocelis subcapitata]|eukprot:GBF97437.1 gamma carbonic anhydrase-like mitochondrial [Raphidocelis subcapitata]
MRSQRAILGLLARARAASEPLTGAPVPLAAQRGLLQQVAPSARAFAAAPPGPSVAPAVTSVDISQEWYNRQRQTIPLGNRVPETAVGAYIAPSATIVGDVDLLDRVSIWNHAVLRGDLNNITIGQVSNVQDRTVIHAARTSPTGLTAAVLIGKFVTIEPNCTLRSCRVQDNCIVGARSVLMEGSMMESHSVLAPGSVLPPARRVPEGELWAGNPARFVRKLSEDEKEEIRTIADDVRRLAWQHAAEELPHGTAWRGVEAQRAAQVAGGKFGWIDMRRLKYDVRVKQEQDAAAQRL